jgi:PKD repeat protein
MLVTLFFLLSFIHLNCFSQDTVLPDYPNLKLWLLADSVNKDVDNTVFNWLDASGNNNDVFQTDELSQPLLVNNGLNNRSVIRFDGIDDYFTGGDICDISDTGATFFIVGMSNTNNASYLAKALSGGGGKRYGVYYFGSTFNFLFNSNNNYDISFSHTNGNYEIITTSVDFVNTINQVYINGEFKQNRTISSFNNMDSNFDFLIGAYNNSTGTIPPASGFFLNGDIAEIIIYDKPLTSDQRIRIEHYLFAKYFPTKYVLPVNLGNDIIIDYGFCDTIISAGIRFNSFLWSNSQINDSINVSNSGSYFVTVVDSFGYTSSDTINVYYPDILVNNLIDTTICLGDTLTFVSGLNRTGYNFLWSDNSSDSLLKVTSPGSYWVRVTDSLGCFQYSDTITVAIDSFSVQTTLGPDKTVCQGERINLTTGTDIISYLWSTNDTVSQTVVDTAGIYWIQTTNINGCVAVDSIQISTNGIAPTLVFDFQDTCNNMYTVFNNSSFTTDGSNIIDWHWNFGDGDTSIIQSPQNKYDTAGVYNVVLQVLTDSGCVNSVQQQITIHKKPTAGFFPNNGLICSNQNATFSNNSFSSDGIINSWDWDFGVTGLLDTSSLENGVYSFPNSGSFNVQLISLTEYGCSDTVSQFVNVKQTPTASFLIQDSCDNSPVGFINTSEGNLFSVFWDFGDFNSSTLNNPNHIYNTAGVYNTKLIVKDLNGCWDTLVSPITINENPEANFINDDYCVLSTIQLYDSSSTNSGFIDQWEWSILNTDYNSIIQNPQFLFNTSDTGVFNLKLKVANSFGCLDSVTKVISIYPLPVPEFTFSPQIGLPPLEVHFTNNSTGANTSEWDFGDNNISTSFDPVYTYTDSNIFDVKLTVTSLYGCKDSVENTIQVINPIADVAVRDVIYSLLPNSDLMRVTVQLDNGGVVSIQTLDLMLFNSSTGKVLEKWEGNILPNTQELVELSSIIEVPRGEIPDVICVEALMPNNSIDADDSNNEFCKSLLKFDLINIYPNPTINELNMELIFPESNQLEITLFNEIGKKVSMLYNGITEKGLNRYGFLLGSYSNGIYFVEIRFKDESIKKKIMIN